VNGGINVKKLVSIVLSVMMVFALTACGDASGASDVVKLGVLGPTTGDYSLYGESVRDGALLAAKEINAAGGVDGKMIEIVSYDTKGDPVEGVNAYNRLRDQDGVTALVGGTFSGVTLGIKDLAVADNMPMLTPTATNANVTLDAANVFRACYTDAYQGQVAAVFTRDELGAKTAAVLYNKDDAYSEGVAQAFIDEFGDGVVLVEAYGASDDDYSAVLSKVKDAGVDAVFLPDYISTVGVVLTQMDSLGLDVPVVGADGWDGIEGDYADVAEGMYFTNHYAKDDESALVQDFISNYSAEYQMDPNALSALGYDAVYVMVEAIKAGGDDSQAIVDALAATDFQGVTGHVTFDSNGDPMKSISVITIKDGEQKLVTKVSN
jgi:branched-chain amino acid transport system substrate-binding protein